MKSLWFMPLTFVAGQHGFALFAPYLGVFLAMATLFRGRRRIVAALPMGQAMPAVALSTAV